MERSNWTAMMTLENLTQEQIDELIVRLIEFVEDMGGFVGSVFMPEGKESNS